MLIVLEDDGCIHAYSSPETAVRAIESIDAKETIRAAFDETGVPYQIVWREANKEGRILGLVTWVQNGQYELVPSGPPDRYALIELITSTRTVVPNEVLALLTNLKRSI
ncbi:MAG TPA: hypothetical protein VIV60_21770 [Polyangiaceae bacterium]